jgi:hypothetical protein
VTEQEVEMILKYEYIHLVRNTVAAVYEIMELQKTATFGTVYVGK